MFTETETLRTRLHQLRLAGHSLADLLQIDADRLDTEGRPPAPRVAEGLRRYREQVSQLNELLHAGFGESTIPQFQSVAEIDAELLRRDIAAQATKVARSILQITPHDQQMPAGLDTLQSAAREMIASQGMNLPREEVQQLSKGRHPWCDLLRMIRESETLPDTEWTSLNHSIETALGRSVAVAAARGRLVLPEPFEADSKSELNPDQAPVVTNPPPVEASVTSNPELVAEPTPLPTEFEVPVMQSGSRRSVLLRAVAKAKSEITTFEQTVLDPSDAVSEVEQPAVARIDEVVSATGFPEVRISSADPELSPVILEPVDDPIEPSQSVFDDIEPVAIHDKYSALKSAPEAPAPEPASRSVSCPMPSSSSIFDDEADDENELVMDREIPSTPNTPTDLAATRPAAGPSPVAERLLAQARFTDATGPAASLATTILNGHEADRVDLLPDLILHLIHEGRPGLAYHLSRSLEDRGSEDRPFVPSWLIRTWTYGHALVFPKGQLAGLLQDDLRAQTSFGQAGVSRDWRLAFSLLVRAATLRPAIIAPACRAASVLRDFELRDDCVQLYNYCSRIGTYGERIQGIFPGLFKQSSASVPYSDQLTTLRSDIERWRESADTVGLKTQIASQLFQKTGWSLRAGTSQRHAESALEWMNWQIALRIGESLISPVVADRRTELARVKAELEDVSTRLSAAESGEERRQLLQPQIRAYLRQAATFAERWVSLHSGAATNEAQNYLPQAAVELRSEIQHRHSLVIDELQVLASENTSFEVRMAITCLMLSVMEIRDLVDPSIPADSREADPRHLLHSDLLKIPDLRLGSNWEPEVDLHSLEEELLQFLSQPQPDWTTAFKMQMARGNHHLAERILSLSIWTDEERMGLQGVLNSDRSRHRTDFSHDLNEVSKLLAESVQLDILKDTERTGFETRLRRLKRCLTSDADISSGILELGRVRELLTKRREREADRIRSRLRALSASPSESGIQPSTGGLPSCTSLPPGWVMDFEQ